MLDAYPDRWALITGASSGIGAEFARRLAALGMHLVLSARREPEMKALADELDTRHGTRCEIIPLDLAEPGSASRLVDEIQSRNIDIELLINNAGFAHVATIDETNVDRLLEMVRLNVGALTELTYRLVKPMAERGHGAVINLSSLAGFQPVAYMGAYAATKAYALHLSEALWVELRESGVTVMALCPGPTSTGFFDAAGVPEWLKMHSAQTPEQVVKKALKFLEKKRQFAVCGWKNYLLALMTRFASRRMVVNESRKYFRPMPRTHRKNSDEEEKPADDESA